MLFTLLFSASLVSRANMHLHIFVHYFALLICNKSKTLSLEAGQTCGILRLALWALLGLSTLDLPVWQAFLDNAKSLGRVF